MEDASLNVWTTRQEAFPSKQQKVSFRSYLESLARFRIALSISLRRVVLLWGLWTSRPSLDYFESTEETTRIQERKGPQVQSVLPQ
jgi:hypothetical protein